MLRRLCKLPTDRTFAINIGCGKRVEEDAVGIDILDCGQQIVWDVFMGIPIADNCVNLVYMYHFLEHVPYGRLDALFKEIHRICIDGAIIKIHVPPADGPRGHAPHHVSFWTPAILRSFFGCFADENCDRIDMFHLMSVVVKDTDIISCLVEVVKEDK